MAIHIKEGDYILRQPDAAGPEVGQLVVIADVQHWLLYTEVDDAVNDKEAKPADTKAKYDRPKSTSAAAIALFFEYKGAASSPFNAAARRGSFDSRIKVQYIAGAVGGATRVEDPEPRHEAAHHRSHHAADRERPLPLTRPENQVDPWKYGLYQKGLLVGYVEVVGYKFSPTHTTESWTLLVGSIAVPPTLYAPPDNGAGGSSYALLPTATLTEDIAFPAGTTLETVVVDCISS